MKTRRLPITDLARICVQPFGLQRSMLKQVKGGGRGPNYNPTRRQFPGIVNRQPGVFESKRDDWTTIEGNIRSACRSDDEWHMNEPVARQLFNYCVESAVRAIEVEGFPISFSVGPKLMCWSPAIFIYPDRITIPFLDLRRTRNLHREAMRCIFSLQHHALRVNNPDHSEITFEILKFANTSERSLQVHTEDERWLFSYEELEQMIAVTQRLWFDVLAEREEEIRRTGTGKTGDLL